MWSWTGARLAAPAAGRGCRSCLTQTVSLGWEGGRGAQIAAGSPTGKWLHPLRLKETGAAVSGAVLPSAFPHGSDQLDHGSMCCCPCLMDHTGLASVAGLCWVLSCGARPGPCAHSAFLAHWFLMGQGGHSAGWAEETPSGAVWELHPIVLEARPLACWACVTQEYFSRFQAVNTFF